MFVNRIEEFYNKNRRELFTYALSMTGDVPSAEDAVHDALASLLEKGVQPLELRPYVFKCVRNAVMDQKRTHARAGIIFADPVFQVGHPPDTKECFDAAIMGEALSALNDVEREAVVLRIFDDLTFKEMADVMNVSQNTVASWYRRALRKLRDFLKDHTE